MSSSCNYVSREAHRDLMAYWNLLLRWNTAIGLIAPASCEGGWQRHIEDSTQLVDYFPARSVCCCDLGSGGGLPAIPVGILRRDRGFEDGLIMIEADARKAAFLRTVLRELELNARIVVGRIEQVTPCGAELTTARALAPLDHLLDYVSRHLALDGRAILPKGRNFEEEIEQARRRWAFDIDRCSSRTAPDASVLVVSNIKRLEDESGA